jgi:3,4-dihydroxy 2-butanone 4-phosphate synthase/GTP cyclohydrolase II
LRNRPGRASLIREEKLIRFFWERIWKMPLAPIEEVIADIKAGKMIILVDDEDRENEGDLTMAAQFITPEAVNFMVTHARGLICLALNNAIADQLNLSPMVQDNQSPFSTAFTVSIEARHGVTTGISAFDRAHTVQVASAPDAKPGDLVSPGHIFPLRARDGGVLVRTGQTEGSVDLARLAGLREAAVICEVMNEDGSMARLPDLEVFAARHGLKIASIADLIAYRMHHETLVKREVMVRLPTAYGDFNIAVYSNQVDQLEHVALVKGTIAEEDTVLVRVHSECLTGDLFHSLRCDCGEQLVRALRLIEEEGKGVLLYMHQEGRGIGLVNKLKAYQLQDQGKDTVEANEALGFGADLRDYGIGAQILYDLGVRKMRLLTNNPKKMVALLGYGLSAGERVPLEVPPRPENERYLKTKCLKLGHLLQLTT